MTAGPPLLFPGSRVLAGWWRQLAPLKARALWIGHLALHRLEALVRIQRSTAVDAFPRFVLKALNLCTETTLEDLERRLALGRPLLRQVLHSLRAENLVAAPSAADWSLTPLGRHAAENGAYPLSVQEQLPFYFVETDRALHYLRLRSPISLPLWPGSESARVPVAADLLDSCLRQSVDWKTRHGFDREVTELVPAAGAAENLGSFQERGHICIARVEHLVALLALTKGDTRLGPKVEDGRSVESRESMATARLLGFAVEPNGWMLHTTVPAFVLDEDWQAPFPELANPLAAESWREAWRTWCQPRGLPAAEVEACKLETNGCRLEVKAPNALVQRLRAARSDVFKGEAWLLAGKGRLRMAAQVELASFQRNPSSGKSSGRR